MTINETREKNDNDLQKELLDLCKVQFGLRMQMATQHLRDNSQVGKVRKDIARIKTIRHEKAMVK